MDSMFQDCKRHVNTDYTIKTCILGEYAKLRVVKAVKG